jgi:hypothetical protein
VSEEVSAWSSAVHYAREDFLTRLQIKTLSLTNQISTFVYAVSAEAAGDLTNFDIKEQNHSPFIALDASYLSEAMVKLWVSYEGYLSTIE